MLKMHIFLIGLQGAGKSALGRRLAQELGVRLFETEDRIRELLGNKPLEDFSGLMGGEFLSNIETGVLMELTEEPPCVAVVSAQCCNTPENVSIMKNHGVLVFIERPLDQLLEQRAGKASVLHGQLSRDEIVYQYENSIGKIKAAADYTVNNGKGLQLAYRELSEIADSFAESSFFD